MENIFDNALFVILKKKKKGDRIAKVIFSKSS